MLVQIKYKIGVIGLGCLLIFFLLWGNKVKAVYPVQEPVQSIDSIKPIKVFKQTGIASYYGKKFHGRRTASGERYSKHKLTAAHKTLPFGTLVRVADAKTGRWLIVRVNDRGPHHRKRIIDLSYEAARQLGMTKGAGLMKVKIRVVEWPKGYQPE